MSTIFAVSSGAPPAAIAIMRLSGPEAFASVSLLLKGGTLPPPRYASLRALHDPVTGELLDRALVLLFPSPDSATGEDIAELHMHGGRAVVRGVEDALRKAPGLREAEPGEFTRRALASGRIDLTEAEALSDLLTAETQAQRRAALVGTEGSLRRLVETWTDRTVALAAIVEAVIDHGEDEDLGGDVELMAGVRSGAITLAAEIQFVLTQPSSERLHHGIRVVFAGPPNAGKSSLINAMADRQVAIVSEIAGTTRDRVEVGIQHGGIAWLLTDTAGLAEVTDDPIERIGISLAKDAMSAADIVVWLGDDEPNVDGRVVAVQSRCDEAGRAIPMRGRLSTSAVTGFGVGALWERLHSIAYKLLPPPDQIALNDRQRRIAGDASAALAASSIEIDELLTAAHLQSAMRAFDRLTGRAGTEAMLDALFGRFCIGK